jgi:hypothetical protein
MIKVKIEIPTDEITLCNGENDGCEFIEKWIEVPNDFIAELFDKEFKVGLVTSRNIIDEFQLEDVLYERYEDLLSEKALIYYYEYADDFE